MSEPPPDDPDAPLLPPTSSDNDLRDAVGAKPVAEPVTYSQYGEPTEPAIQEYALYTPTTTEPSYAAPVITTTPPQQQPEPEPAKPKQPKKSKRKATEPGDRDDDGDKQPRSRKGVVIGALTLLVGLVIGTLIFLGRANSDRFFIECEPDQIVAEQGRSFPPWGTHLVEGTEWKPIAIPPSAECKPRDTKNLAELTGWYLDLLYDQANSLLEAKEVTKVDLAEQELKQALLLARSPDRRDQRKDIERRLGDIDYWRALSTLREATSKLGDAAKQFETAAAQRPRYVSDAAAWAAYIRKIADELHVGPAGAHASAFPPSAPPSAEHPPAPPGVALPVEPPPTPVEPPPPAPDAGVPTGGVLL